ncbi:hypothetical protein V498_01845 [Pseudogymnoascus sp. VKM F-4517 (FW-2822)]|nr:hypothetical protein V498_01845 [Pseudogymnoascus sp. VKM F-4517 (FW-2822)]
MVIWFDVGGFVRGGDRMMVAGESFDDKNPFKASAKCTYCVAQKGKCVAFLADEYKDLASEEASSNPDPAVINAAAKEIERVAQVAGKNFPKFKTPYERASYIEHLALRRSLEEATTRTCKSAYAAHQDSLAV